MRPVLIYWEEDLSDPALSRSRVLTGQYGFRKNNIYQPTDVPRLVLSSYWQGAIIGAMDSPSGNYRVGSRWEKWWRLLGAKETGILMAR